MLLRNDDLNYGIKTVQPGNLRYFSIIWLPEKQPLNYKPIWIWRTAEAVLEVAPLFRGCLQDTKKMAFSAIVHSFIHSSNLAACRLHYSNPTRLGLSNWHPPPPRPRYGPQRPYPPQLHKDNKYCDTSQYGPRCEQVWHLWTRWWLDCLSDWVEPLNLGIGTIDTQYKVE